MHLHRPTMMAQCIRSIVAEDRRVSTTTLLQSQSLFQRKNCFFVCSTARHKLLLLLIHTLLNMQKFVITTLHQGICNERSRFRTNYSPPKDQVLLDCDKVIITSTHHTTYHTSTKLGQQGKHQVVVEEGFNGRRPIWSHLIGRSCI